jgi:hypothetical protein
MGGFLTLFGRGGGCCNGDHGDHGGYARMGNCEAEVLMRMPILRYLKEPVLRIEELDAQYPYGGQPGWYALVIASGQFAYWDAMYNRWDYVKYPPVTAETLLAGLGIEMDSMADGATFVWDQSAKVFKASVAQAAEVDTNAGRIDLRARFVRRIAGGGLALTGNNVYPHITPAGGHVCTIWFRSIACGMVTFPASPSDSFDGKTWVCFNGDHVSVPGGKWAQITVAYTGNEYMAKCEVSG